MEQRKVKKMTNELLIKISRFKGLIRLFCNIFTGYFDQITNVSNKTWETYFTENIM